MWKRLASLSADRAGGLQSAFVAFCRLGERKRNPALTTTPGPRWVSLPLTQPTSERGLNPTLQSSCGIIPPSSLAVVRRVPLLGGRRLPPGVAGRLRGQPASGVY